MKDEKQDKENSVLLLQSRYLSTFSDEINFGYDAMNKKFGDMIAFGVIVPTKVERTALQNGASIASLLLTTDAIVSEIPEKKEAGSAMPPGGGMY